MPGAFRLLLACLAASFLTDRDVAAATPPGFDDWLLAPVRVHLLHSTNTPALHTTLTGRDIDRILGKLNGIWSQAGLTFWLESLVHEDTTFTNTAVRLGEAGNLRALLEVRPAASRASNVFHLYYIKQFSANGVYLGPAMFIKDTIHLREIPGGIEEHVPRTTAHELGHALGLPHTNILDRLMARGTTGTNLAPDEILQAREAARKISWIEPATRILHQAEGEPRNSPAARALYRPLTFIPLDQEPVRRARERSQP